MGTYDVRSWAILINDQVHFRAHELDCRFAVARKEENKYGRIFFHGPLFSGPAFFTHCNYADSLGGGLSFSPIGLNKYAGGVLGIPRSVKISRNHWKSNLLGLCERRGMRSINDQNPNV